MKLFLFLSFFNFQQSPLDSVSIKCKILLDKRIDSLSKSPFLQNGFMGVSIKSVKTGQNIVSYNSQKSLAPASTMKLISTGTAMMVLGENFTYQTLLNYAGNIEGNILKGNIYIKGSGDPSLGSWRFKYLPDYKQLTDNWVKSLKDMGITEIQGDVYGDGSFFDENAAPDQWNWGDMGNYYGSGCTGLNFNENLFWVTFQPGSSINAEAKFVKTAPELPYLQIVNTVKTDKSGTGDQVNIYGTPFQNTLWMQGFVPQGNDFSVKGAIPDPALFAAFYLKKRLEENGIKVSGTANSNSEQKKKSGFLAKPSQVSTIYTHNSPPLKELIRECNFWSINLYAEACLKTPSVILNAGNTNKDALKNWMQLWKTKGLNLGGFNPKDGSGLAPANGITPDNMTDILKQFSQEKIFNSYYESIPVLGISGTVSNLGKNTLAHGNVHAKSGSIDGVRAYGGYFKNRAGELMSFSLILNKYNSEFGSATKELEKIMIQMCDL